MSKIKVDTDSLRYTANKIKKINLEINDCFFTVQNAVKKLEETWSGTASNNVISAFENVKKLENNRMQIFNNYQELLEKTVAQGFEKTESANIKLSDLFK